MTSEPVNSPVWQAIHREASLVAQLIGSGATALGRASYGNGLGEYYTAFFGLSVGIERLAKLVLIADFVIENDGELPSQAIVRKYGHKLKALLDQAATIAAKRNTRIPHLRPSHPICSAVVDCLETFADASMGRYANFEAIGNPSFDPDLEPVNKWWTKVVEPILTKHYRGSRREVAVKNNAQIIDAMIGHVSLVRFVDEHGSVMSDVQSASERTGQTKWAQKYGRFYALCVVRWLACIFADLSRSGGYEHGIVGLFGHYELFNTYTVDDSFLLSRKVWPLR